MTSAEFIPDLIAARKTLAALKQTAAQLERILNAAARNAGIPVPASAGTPDAAPKAPAPAPAARSAPPDAVGNTLLLYAPGLLADALITKPPRDWRNGTGVNLWCLVRPASAGADSQFASVGIRGASAASFAEGDVIRFSIGRVTTQPARNGYPPTPTFWLNAGDVSPSPFSADEIRGTPPPPAETPAPAATAVPEPEPEPAAPNPGAFEADDDFPF